MANAFENFWLKSFPAIPIYGIVVTRYGHTLNCKHIDVIEAGHPLPDANGTSAANRIFELARGLTKDDLAVCLISGGCSALLSLPADGIELDGSLRLRRAQGDMLIIRSADILHLR